MRWVNKVCVLLLLLGVPSLRAADSKTDEAAIRAAIASDLAKPTDDEIVWVGLFKRPFVLPEKGETFPGLERSKRLNQKIKTTDVQRIEVAASGDLAYEFSYGTVDFDLAGPPAQHVAYKVGQLRVWKKVDGEWRMAALFARPLDLLIDLSARATAK
jgi:ketosteroid isomerase-like protein